MLKKLLWKVVRETDSYRYEQHRFVRARRAILKPGAKGRPARHKAWLDGGEFGTNLRKKVASI